MSKIKPYTYVAGDDILASEQNETVDEIYSQIKFGGDGSDGALNISSGTTTVDLGNSAIVVKQYTSISITGTGQLAFSNPNTNGTIIILKSQGNVVLTSSATPNIEASGMGGQGGAGGARQQALAGGGSNGGANGSNFIPLLDATNHYGSGITGGVIYSYKEFYTSTYQATLSRNSIVLFGGSGGAGGASGVKGINNGATTPYGGAGGNGGSGGGALLIECASDLNFTGSIYSKGINGSAGENPYKIPAYFDPVTAGGGGGGGSGGMVVVLYNTATATSGTISNAGGNGGNGGSQGSSAGGFSYTNAGGYGGAGAGSLWSVGANGVNGTTTNGNNGSNASTYVAGASGGSGSGDANGGPYTGGTGGTGGATQGTLIAENKYF